jgi:hypothetical protein
MVRTETRFEDVAQVAGARFALHYRSTSVLLMLKGFSQSRTAMSLYRELFNMQFYQALCFTSRATGGRRRRWLIPR